MTAQQIGSLKNEESKRQVSSELSILTDEISELICRFEDLETNLSRVTMVAQPATMEENKCEDLVPLAHSIMLERKRITAVRESICSVIARLEL